MRKEAFCEVFGDIREDYVQEARAGRKVRKPVRFKWAAVAACLCLALALPLAALAVDTVRYNAAVDYLTSLGIPVEDLGGYSRAEIKEAAKTIDAGGSSTLAEEILGLLPGTGEEPAGSPAQVTSEQVRALTPDMTREVSHSWAALRMSAPASTCTSMRSTASTCCASPSPATARSLASREKNC